MVIGVVEAFAIMISGRNLSASGSGMLVAIVITLMLGVMLGTLQWFMPYAVVVLGLAKLFEQRKEAIDALGDDNTVNSDPDGERKLHDYLTAISSTEARIGLLQRSAPYVPPEQRAPENARMPHSRLSKTGWSVLSATLVAGAISGAFIAAFKGVGFVDAGTGSEVVARNTGLLRLFISSLIGAVLSLPVGVIMALLFGRIEAAGTEAADTEEPDDAGRSGPETA